MSSILPKGILVNTPGISSNIERIDKEPLANEEIAKLWKVYTTTNRRLLDPTAERLENYWWRIWGSQKRSLRGATVARLFVEISNGTSFVPLLGPADYNESRTTCHTPSPRPSSGTASTPATQSLRPEGDGRQNSTASNSSVNLPPPILKKTSSTSYTGPRPMTRFISPRSSEDEDDDGAPTDTNCRVIIEPPTPDTQIPSEDANLETEPAPRKKPHGSASVNVSQKRKSETPRKPSSLSPDSNSQNVIVSKGASGRFLPKTTEPFSRNTRPQSQFQKQENSSLSPDKKPMARKVPKRARSVKIESLKKSPEQTGTKLDPALASSSRQSKPTGERSPSNSKSQFTRKVPTMPGLKKEELKELELKETILAQAKSNLKTLKSQREDAVVAGQGCDNPHKSQRSKSVSDKNTMLLSEHQFPKVVDTKSPASLAATHTAAAPGKLNFRDGQDQANAESGNFVAPSKAKEKGKGKEPQASPFIKRPVQCIPIATTASENIESQTIQDSSELSRSKSQLTLLLENDRARATRNGDESNIKLSSVKGGGK